MNNPTPDHSNQVAYTPQLDIRNVASLARGIGAPFLLCLQSPEPGVLIAHSWKRKAPVIIADGYVLVIMPTRAHRS
jgi:hypothetical protein